MTVHHRIEAPKALRVHASDNVAVALADTPAGASIALGAETVSVRMPIPAGHKFALKNIGEDEQVVKYGSPIGLASASISVGEHVHSHNLRTALNDVETYPPFSALASDTQQKLINDTFMGYRRADGRVGVRNEIWILPTVGCVANTAERIAREMNASAASENIDGVYAFLHPFGCSQLGDDLDGTRSILAALSSHPNAAGVLILGLGCESNQLSRLLVSVPEKRRTRIRAFSSQEVEDEFEAGIEAVKELNQCAAEDEREVCKISDLVIGVKCGGSDGFSGLTANPLVGRITDRLTAAGGTSVMTEIPELFGAERPLLQRCASEDVYDRFVTTVNDFKNYFIAHDQPIYENPSPGNIKGGITTLEEKSLGAAQKAGANSVVTDVLRYGELVNQPGLSILESPGNDAVSSTALTAAGATIILFTTGRGTPLGFPAPTIKIASNTSLSERKPRWIDFDAGAVLEAESRETIEEALWRKVIAVASGETTRNEENNERSIAIWKRGVTL
mgnify:FL=1